MSKDKMITDWNEVPVLIDVPMAARILGKTVDYISRLCKNGEIPAHKVGREWRIFKDEIIEYVRGC